MKIICVAVVGKANNPLYIKTFDSQADPLRYHFIVHTSLDVVEEKMAATVPANPSATPNPTQNKKTSTDLYLGFLCPTEDYKVYGFVTNTKVKLIAVLDDSETKDSDLKSFFRSFHSAFADAISNPFYVKDEKITSKKFEREIITLVRSKSPESFT